MAVCTGIVIAAEEQPSWVARGGRLALVATDVGIHDATIALAAEASSDAEPVVTCSFRRETASNHGFGAPACRPTAPASSPTPPIHGQTPAGVGKSSNHPSSTPVGLRDQGCVGGGCGAATAGMILVCDDSGWSVVAAGLIVDRDRWRAGFDDLMGRIASRFPGSSRVVMPVTWSRACWPGWAARIVGPWPSTWVTPVRAGCSICSPLRVGTPRRCVMICAPTFSNTSRPLMRTWRSWWWTRPGT